MSHKLSVVIPVWCTEATLDRCVSSVVSQDYAPIEVILVDDGSPDDCPRLCDQWAARDSRVSAIHQSNGGLSAARNAGIAAAGGDYITFVDSDDYLALGTYRQLMQRLEERPDIDLLEFPVCQFYGSRRQRMLCFPDEREYRDMQAYWYEAEAWSHAYACNKVFKRSLFSCVRFPVGICFEDIHTLPLLLAEASLVATANQGLYYYCANPLGITATADGHRLSMLLAPHADIIRKSHRRDAAFSRYYMHVLNIQMDVCELTGQEPILPYIPQPTKALRGLPKLKAMLLNRLGIKRLSVINSMIHKIWRNH